MAAGTYVITSSTWHIAYVMFIVSGACHYLAICHVKIFETPLRMLPKLFLRAFWQVVLRLAPALNWEPHAKEEGETLDKFHNSDAQANALANASANSHIIASVAAHVHALQVF